MISAGSRAAPDVTVGDWPTYNRNLDSSRYSPLTAIDRTNVARLKLLAGLAIIALAAPAIGVGETPSTAFAKANAIAMERMMARMAVPATGDVDTDFVNMMEPHHRGAIDMAQLELRYGKNERLRRLAQEIIITQQQEIVAMRLALDRPLPIVSPAAGAGAARVNAGSNHHGQ